MYTFTYKYIFKCIFSYIFAFLRLILPISRFNISNRKYVNIYIYVYLSFSMSRFRKVNSYTNISAYFYMSFEGFGTNQFEIIDKYIQMLSYKCAIFFSSFDKSIWGMVYIYLY